MGDRGRALLRGSAYGIRACGIRLRTSGKLSRPSGDDKLEHVCWGRTSMNLASA